MSWLDILPANERQKIREKYKMSAAAYEKLRRKVKGPEQMEKELRRNELMAQLQFGLETKRTLKDALKKQIEKDIAEQGMEAVLLSPDISTEIRLQIESGRFEVSVDSPDEAAPDRLVVRPEGNVSEKIPITTSFTEAYLSQLS